MVVVHPTSLYESGVLSIERQTTGMAQQDWQLTACGAWDVADTVRHLLGTTTVGLRIGVAATEWHLHAWDIAHARGSIMFPPELANSSWLPARRSLTSRAADAVD